MYNSAFHHFLIMDYSFSSLQILALTILLILFLALKTFKKPTTPQKLPPGPWKLPVIGNIHQLLHSLPHHCLRDLAKKYGPIMHLRLGEVPHVVVSSPDLAMQVMKTHDISLANRPFSLASSILTYNFRDIAFAPYGVHWRQARKICTLDLFSAKRVQSFRSIREEEVLKIVKSILAFSSNSRPLNLKEMLLYLTSSITCRAAFGQYSERESGIFISLINKMSELLSAFSVADFFPSIGILHEISGVRANAMKVHREIDGVLQRIIDEHRARKDKVGFGGTQEVDNLLDVLLRLHDGGDDHEFQLTMQDVKGIIFDVFAAGMETSATTMEWVMSEVLKNPTTLKNVQDELRRIFDGKHHIINESSLQELKYLNATIKETLRLHPPGPLLVPRQARETVNINGYEIPKKTIVLVNAWAIGRDPNYWSEAERFYPERFIDSLIDYKGSHFEYIPFGAGRRICVALSFATSTMELALANLLYHFDWKLPNGASPEDLDMSESFGLVCQRKNPLQLVAVPYCPPLKN